MMAYGETAEDAIAHVQALALRVLADRLEHGEGPRGPMSVSFETSAAAWAGGVRPRPLASAPSGPSTTGLRSDRKCWRESRGGPDSLQTISEHGFVTVRATET